MVNVDKKLGTQIGISIVVDSGVLYHIGRDEQKGNVNRLCNIVEIMNMT